MSKDGLKIMVVMPAYNAERTLEQTVRLLPPIYDEILLCDDGSKDKTYEKSTLLGITTIQHKKNRGYGANQKTLYAYALERATGIIIMVHPDNQYNTQCLPQMIELIRGGGMDLVLGNRMNTARINNMPWWKYVGNSLLTFFQNVIFGARLSEFHSGLRVYNASVLAKMPFKEFSDDFVFDSEVIAWFFAQRLRVGEVSTECYYNEEVSSINLQRSVRYGLSTLHTLYKYMTGRYG